MYASANCLVLSRLEKVFRVGVEESAVVSSIVGRSELQQGDKQGGVSGTDPHGVSPKAHSLLEEITWGRWRGRRLQSQWSKTTPGEGVCTPGLSGVFC